MLYPAENVPIELDADPESHAHSIPILDGFKGT